jgi:hypothetical protein
MVHKKKSQVKFEENESLGYLSLGNLFVQGDDYSELKEKAGIKDDDSDRTKIIKLMNFLDSAGYDYRKEKR